MFYGYARWRWLTGHVLSVHTGKGKGKTIEGKRGEIAAQMSRL